jgi:hypothetical protein
MLPTLIEYLATLPLLTENRPLCRPATASVNTLVLPNDSLQLQATPGRIYYGMLHYATAISALPERLEFYMSQLNESFYEALVTEEQMLEPAGHLIFITKERPVDITIINRTALNQGMSLTLYFLMLSTMQDWNVLQQMVSEYGSRRTNELLGQIAEKMK